MIGLSLSDVAVSRGAGPVLTGVTCTIEPGEITALVGPNGAGKTSLLEAVSGVIAPSAGTMLLDGKPLASMSRVRRARAGLVHIEQGRAVFPSLTVLENVRLTARDDAALDSALALFPELSKRANSQAALLSGGEQQMVVLARAFAARPRYLLIDEMSLGLAPVVFTRLLPIVQSMANSGVGVLLVEQFTNLALGVATDAIMVSGGAVRYSGDAATLRAEPEVLHQAYLGTASARA